MIAKLEQELAQQKADMQKQVTDMRAESQKLSAQVSKIEQASKTSAHSNEVAELQRLQQKNDIESKRLNDRLHDLEKELKDQIE